jgi:WD40 repeat protein
MIDPMAAAVASSAGRPIPARTLDFGAFVAAVGFAADGVVAFACGDGEVKLIAPDAGGQDQPRRVAAHRGAVLAMVGDPESGGFLTGGDDGRLCRIAPDGAVSELASFKGKFVDVLAAHANSKQHAVAVGREVHVFSARGVRVLGPHASSVADIAFSPDGSRLAAAHYNGVSIWTLRNQADQPRKLEWKGSHVKVSYSPNGKVIATTTQDNAIHAWRLASGADMQMSGYPTKIKSLSWSADSLTLLSSATDAFVCWSYEGKGPEGKPPSEFGGPQKPGLITVVAVHAGAPFAIAGYDTGEILLGDLARKRALAVRPPGDSAISALAWSRDGWQLAWGAENGAAGLLDLKLK